MAKEELELMINVKSPLYLRIPCLEIFSILKLSMLERPHGVYLQLDFLNVGMWLTQKTTGPMRRPLRITLTLFFYHELSLPSDQPVLVIFDRFKAQCTEKIFKMLDDNNIRLAVVPANCTDRLQPLDVSVNKSAKEYLRRQFDQVCAQLERNEVCFPSNVCGQATWC